MRWALLILGIVSTSLFLIGPAERSAPVANSLPEIEADRLVLEKSIRQLSLYKGETLIRRYEVSLGSNPIGAKKQEGDGRTPKGRYVIDWHKPDSSFHLALHVSYPSYEDEKNAASFGVSPGGDIFLHGSPSWWPFDRVGPPGDWTQGCIAVTNQEIEEIWALVPDGTFIEILP